MQCTDLVSGEMQESSSQDVPHSTGDFLAPTPPIVRRNILTDAILQHEPMKERIKWPKMSDMKEWNSLDNDLDIVLEATLAGTAEQKVTTLTEITYNLAKERFGATERKCITKTGKQPSRRERKIHSLREEIKSLNRRYKTSSTDEREGIKKLTSSLQESFSRLRRTERTRKLSKEKENRRAQFVKDPYNFTRSILGEVKSGSLSSSKEDVEAYLKGTHSDFNSSLPLGENPGIDRAEPPTIMLNTSEPTWKEVQDVVKKAQAAGGYGNCSGGSGRKALYRKAGRGQKDALSPNRRPQQA